MIRIHLYSLLNSLLPLRIVESEFRPHVVKEIREPSEDGSSIGELVKELTPNILNTVDNTQEEIQQVRKGCNEYIMVVQGTAEKLFRCS